MDDLHYRLITALWEEIANTNLLVVLKEVDVFFCGIGNMSDVQIGDETGNEMITAK